MSTDAVFPSVKLDQYGPYESHPRSIIEMLNVAQCLEIGYGAGSQLLVHLWFTSAHYIPMNEMSNAQRMIHPRR